LRDDFTAALYHDRFGDLRHYLEEFALSEIDSAFPGLDFAGHASAKVFEILENTHKGVGHEVKKAVQFKLLEYVRENRHHLHLYDNPV